MKVERNQFLGQLVEIMKKSKSQVLKKIRDLVVKSSFVGTTYVAEDAIKIRLSLKLKFPRRKITRNCPVFKVKFKMFNHVFNSFMRACAMNELLRCGLLVWTVDRGPSTSFARWEALGTSVKLRTSVRISCYGGCWSMQVLCR